MNILNDVYCFVEQLDDVILQAYKDGLIPILEHRYLYILKQDLILNTLEVIE